MCTSDSIMVLEEAQVPPGRGEEVREGGVGLETVSSTQREEQLGQSGGGEDERESCCCSSHLSRDSN